MLGTGHEETLPWFCRSGSFKVLIFHEHIVETLYIMVCAGVNRPLSLRSPSSASEEAVIKLKTRELSSGGGL